MDVCVKYKIQIDEEMAERLTVPKGEEGIEPEERRRLLEKMAEACMLQGSYHLAAKKFTQAGDKVSFGMRLTNFQLGVFRGFLFQNHYSFNAGGILGESDESALEER